MSDAYSESKRISNQYDTARWLCKLYFGEIEMPSGIEKESVLKRIYMFGERTPEQLANEIGYKYDKN